MLGIFLLFEVFGVDRAVSDLFYDPAVRRFPLREDWFLEVVIHRWAKYILVLIALGLLGGIGLSFRIGALRAWRRGMVFVFLAMVLGSAAVGALKVATNKHCPYDLEIYGGYAPYLGLFEPSPAGVGAGKCFPGGHASGGFGLMAFYFLWYRRRPRLAYSALAVGLTYGFILGFGRVMQGAHFLSHNLWSAAAVWFVALALYLLLLKRRDESPQGPPA